MCFLLSLIKNKSNFEIKMLINKNAIDLLKHLMKSRGWHNNQLERRLAAAYKRSMTEGNLSYKKAVEILELIGATKVQDETWKLPE
jgi:hypothetical protein